MFFFTVTAFAVTPEKEKVFRGKTGPPTADEDSTVGVLPGTRWIDDYHRLVWLCLDNTEGAAIWVKLGSSNIEVELIDAAADLSTWDNAATGSSYFQAEAGKTYIVDMYALFAAVPSLTGVTGHLPYADARNNEKETKFILVCSGVTGHAVGLTGTTALQVWPAPSSSVTDFTKSSSGKYDDAAAHIQSMQYTLSGTHGVGTVGIYDNSLAYLGESKTWVLMYNSSVSGQITESSYLILDQDELTSNSPSRAASQQSIKAYIDSGTVTMSNKTLTAPTVTTETAYVPTYAGNDCAVTGYVLTEALMQRYRVFKIDADPAGVVNPCSFDGSGGVGPGDGAGVTVYVIVPTAETDGAIYNFMKTDSTATDFFLYVPGGTMSGGTPVSQTTDRTVNGTNVSSCTDFLTMDAFKDSITLIADYDSEVSYWVLNYKNW